MKSDYSNAAGVGDLSAAIRPLAAAVRLAGTDGFYERLLAALGEHLRSDLAMLMRYSRRGRPEYLIHRHLEPEHMAAYLRGLYRVDPIYRHCRRGKARGIKDLAATCTPAELAGDYFKVFLRLTGMADDLVILLPDAGERTLGLVYERRIPFHPREIEMMHACYPLIESLHELHRRHAREREAPSPETPDAHGAPARQIAAEQPAPGLKPLAFKAALDGFLRAELTPRERDIVHLILAGYPNIKIAERLKLSLNTIKNHRKRMYLKLDITTERELFLNFVDFIIHQPEPQWAPKGP